MTPHFVALEDCPPQPWRNGGGQTRELWVWPQAHDWRVRISVADVASDGPFSPYPGLHRHLAVWQGAGLALHCEGDTPPLALTPTSPASAFEGEWPVRATLLQGPVRDLNLMCRGLPGGLWPAAAGQSFVPPHGAAGLFALQGGVLLAPSGEATSGEVASQWAVPAHTLCWFDAAPKELVWAPDLDSGSPKPSAWWLSADVKER